MPVLTTIDLTEEDSRDSSQSSSTLSGSSSQEGQNGSTELVAEEPESRDAGIALEYQVEGRLCSSSTPFLCWVEGRWWVCARWVLAAGAVPQR